MNFEKNLNNNTVMDFIKTLKQGQIYFLSPSSCQMEGIVSLYNYIMIFLVAILCFVTAALIFIIFTHLDGRRHIKRFNNSADLEDTVEWNRFLQKWTHSTVLEIVWTLLPCFILIVIAVPSFILLYSLDEVVDAPFIIKIIGYQWYWVYEYPIILSSNSPEVFHVVYESFMKPKEELTDLMPLRLLEVDMPLVVPHSVNVRLVVTAKDVIHSFAIPALGIKIDAIPGRLNQVTVHIKSPGIFYGQCSELCGVNHAFMPIVLHSVSSDLFQKFLYTAFWKQHGNEVIDLFKDDLNLWSNEKLFNCGVEIPEDVKLKLEQLFPTNSKEENLEYNEMNNLIKQLLEYMDNKEKELEETIPTSLDNLSDDKSCTTCTLEDNSCVKRD